MIQKTKKKLNYNILGYILLTIFTLFLGLLTGFKVNMLKVNATAFTDSNVRYNEGQTLKRSNDADYINIVKGNFNIYYQVFRLYGAGSGVYNHCTFSNNVLTCDKYYQIYTNTTGSISVTTGTYTFTINTNNVVANYGLSEYTYEIVTTGYTEAQYLAYGQQQYTAGQNSVINNPNTYGLYTLAQYNSNYTAGQNSVINNPNTYNLYTTQQYNTYGTNQYNSGYSAGSTAKENDILANPNNYGLYSSAQYVAYGTAQYNAGIQYVQDNPSTYNLYTSAQYNSYGTSQYNSGLLAGQNDVINNPHNYNLYTNTEYNNNYTAGQNAVINDPHTYNLYTSSEYNTYGTNQYNSGYLAGLNDNEAYNLGIQHVLNNPHDYDLYTSSEYNSYGTNQYNAGIQHVLDNWEDYNLYNQTQYDTYGQVNYNNGYQAGIDSYISNNTINEFPNINNILYGCPSGSPINCENNNITGVIDTLKLSDYVPYTTNGYINTPEFASGNYRIEFDTYISSSTTLQFSNINSDVYLMFCDSNFSFIYNNNTMLSCRSIATNEEIQDNSWLVGNDNNKYFNNGININGITTLNISEYLVGNSTSFNYIIITGIDNITSTEYNNFTIKLLQSSLNSDSYNLGYQTGFNNGNKIGIETNQKDYYNKGYNNGYRQATQVGDNSIRGLAETILTSPVEMFKTMFNVEFLDINLAGFILSIFTVIVVIWLIKKLW